jgi:predicted RNA-binding Zn-ribbon protein involved in translation (DUF1610 family)
MLVFSRKELYKRDDVRRLFKALRDGKISRIEPKVDLERTVRYVEVEEILGEQGNVVKNLLEDLAEDGLLIKELLETRVSCPECGSLNVSLRLKCPACGSTSVKREEAIQHVKCKYMDFYTVFKGSGGLMVCPKCSETIEKEEDYLKIGLLYKCLVCGEFSKTPLREFICSKCKKVYGEDDYNPFEVYGYSVNEEMRDVIEVETLDLSPVVKKLRSSFWEVRTSVLLSGESGLEHPFTMIAYRPSEERVGEEANIIVDIVFERKNIDETPVIAFFSQLLDVSIRHAIMIVVPGISDQAMELAKSYGISVFKCEKMEDVADTLWNAIRPIIEEEASKMFMEIAGILETSQVIKNLIKGEGQSPE